MPHRRSAAVRARAWTLNVAACAVLLGPCALAGAGSVADGLPRHALVIGNARYGSAPLPNPVNDARAMAQTLRGLGFVVTLVEDASHRQMAEAIRSFGDALAGSVGLFYYAGHGLQVKGQNYLVPVDSDLQREDEVPFKTVSADEVLAKMAAARNPLNIVILDACRNNPFARAWRSLSTGLAPMEGPPGSIVALATAPGGVAADGAGRNGVYTARLLEHMTEPGLKVEDVFKRVRRAVRRDTADRQIPSEQTVLVDDFYFVPPAASSAPGSLQASRADGSDPVVAEQTLWDAIKDSRRPSDYRAYLERYPQGRFAALAQARATEAAAVAATQASVSYTTPGPAPRSASAFSFSAEEEKMQRAEPARRDRADEALRAPCPPARKAARIRIEVSEQYLSGAALAGHSQGGSLVQAVSDRLRLAGLAVSSAGPAEYVLRGMITSQTSANRYLRLNEVALSTAVSLVSASGRTVSSVVSRDESYAGSDVYGALVDLLELQSGEVASRVYADLCRS